MSQEERPEQIQTTARTEYLSRLRNDVREAISVDGLTDVEIREAVEAGISESTASRSADEVDPAQPGTVASDNDSIRAAAETPDVPGLEAESAAEVEVGQPVEETQG